MMVIKKDDQLISSIANFPNVEKKTVINLDTNEFINLINLSLGFYNPIRGFCNLNDLKKILNKKKIDKRNSWTIPILLNLKSNKKLSKKKFYKLKYNRNIVGLIKTNDLFKIDRKIFSKKVFNTTSKLHPYVKFLYNCNNYFLGGKVFLLQNAIPKDQYFIYNQIRNKGNLNFFKKSVVFSTRNFCHLGHQFLHEFIIKNNKNLTICIIENEGNKFDPNEIVKSYKILKKNIPIYKNILVTKIYLPSFYAGPNEAYLQAKYFNNVGFKKFIIGRNHAGFKNFFKKYESQKIFKRLSRLKIKIIKTKEPLICFSCLNVGFENSKFCRCQKLTKLLTIDGKNVKNLLINKNFLKVKKYLNPYIFNYLKKNLNKIRKFKGLNYYIK
jgi:sulfate adenylyltransferase